MAHTAPNLIAMSEVSNREIEMKTAMANTNISIVDVKMYFFSLRHLQSKKTMPASTRKIRIETLYQVRCYSIQLGCKYRSKRR